MIGNDLPPGDLPPDLSAIERALSGGPLPSPALRGLVTAQVEQELRRSKQLDFWQYAAAVAAVTLVVMNLTLTVSTASPQRSDPGIDREKQAAIQRQLEDMQLPLSPQEIRRQSMLMAAGAELMPVGTPHSSIREMPEGLNR